MHLSSILGRTYKETVVAYKYFSQPSDKEKFFKIIYWMGRTSQEDANNTKRREIVFSSILRQRIGHHIIGENLANTIIKNIEDNKLLDRSITIISAIIHIVYNIIYTI